MKFAISCALGVCVLALILLSLGAAPSSSAFADGSAAVVPDAISPPAAAPTPEPTVTDVSDLWREGEFVAAFILGLFLLCRVLLHIDPKRAWIYTAGISGMSGLVASIGAGVSPNASMVIAAAVTLIALFLRGWNQTPTPTPARRPESGRAILGLLALTASGGAVLLAAGAMWSCAPIRDHGKATASDVVDCSLVSIGEHADEVEAAIRDATNMDGSIDWASAKAVVKRLGLEVGGCALQRAIARLMSMQSIAAPTPSKGALAAGWEQMRVEVLEGRTFKAVQ